MHITPYGAAGQVTGSCHLLEFNGFKVLLDCGLIQGSNKDEARNFEPFGFDVAAIDAVVLSHAHIDHCGRLPVLVQRGFRGPIWTHSASADLLPVMLNDSAALAEQDAERANRHRPHDAPEIQPLFTREDVADTLALVRGLPYGKAQSLCEGLQLHLHDAGHILGSAVVELLGQTEQGSRRLVFSGDLGMPGAPILRDPHALAQADLVLLESTYGDRAHRERNATVAELGEIFLSAWDGGGNVLIPAFAVGRTQEILYWFARHWDDWKLSRWRIFLDSPMAQRVTDVYSRHIGLFDAQAQKVWNGHPKPFHLPNLNLVSDVAQSQAINQIHGGAIIIAGSGMCTGGRIVHHLRQNLARRNAHVLIVGYQANGTLGRRLVDRAGKVRIFGEDIAVNADIHTVGGLSAHADQPQLLAWYGSFENRPPVLLVHGEDAPREALQAELVKRYGCTVRLAQPGQRVAV